MLNSDPCGAEKVENHAIWKLFSYVSMYFMVGLVLLWDGWIDLGLGKARQLYYSRHPALFSS